MSEMAYVMMTVTGSPQDLLPRIQEIEGIKMAHAVYGSFDIIALIEAPDMESLKALVTNKIRTIEGVKSSLTMPVMV